MSYKQKYIQNIVLYIFNNNICSILCKINMIIKTFLLKVTVLINLMHLRIYVCILKISIR